MLAGPWNARLKAGLVAALLIGGLGLFGLRFAGYFAGGATSAAARADYWRAAVANTLDNPVFGSGPGTFQRPYARLKPPAAEMARLAHNDYLEQATDSGIPGFVLYGAWIALLLAALWRREMRDMAGGPEALLRRAVFFGLAGWFLHGFAEFGLYIPAAAWTAFTIAGALLAGDMPNRRP
jgi:O-antigen ligase